MELEFQRLVLRLARRARLARGLEQARLPLSLALGIILGYQLLRLLGPASGLQARAWWLAAFASACALGGFLRGYLGRLDLAGLLFQIDRRLGLHERLSSLYELYLGRGRAEFIPLISARLPSRLEPERALPLFRGRAWLLPAGLILALLLLSWPVFPPFSSAREGQTPGLSRLEALEEKLRALEEELGGLAIRPRPAPRGLSGPEQLQERLAALEEELWGPEAEPALQGEVAARLAQALSSLPLQAEPEGPGEGEAPAPWRPSLEELEWLASRLKGGALKELLAHLRLGQARRQEGRAGVEALWHALAAAESLIERLEVARRRLEGLEQPGLTRGGPAGEGEGLGRESGTGEGPPSAARERGSPGGEEAGTTPGEWPSGLLAAPTLSWPAATRELRISGELGETGAIERLITRGTPFELGGPEGEPQLSLRLDFQRVQAYLEARAIPPEAKRVVQEYFLIITEER